MRILGLAVAAGLAATLLSPAPASAARTGECLNLTSAQRSSVGLPSSRSVACAGSHTAEVLGRTSLPTGVSGRSVRVQRAWAFRACQEIAVTRVVGDRTVPLPLASYALPRTAQLSAFVNNRRVTCVGFNTNANAAVRSRTGSVAGQGLTPHVCLDGRTWRPTGCRARSAVPMTNVVWLSDGLGARYPGTEQVLRQTMIGCIRLGRPQRLEPNAWYSYGPAAWEQGDRFGYCQLVRPQNDSGWQPGPAS